MRIERFRIQGFKSIVDLTVDGLSDINVFFGLNDVGKSNILEALKLWFKLLGEDSRTFSVSPEDAEKYGWNKIFRLQSKTKSIFLDVDFEISGQHFASNIEVNRQEWINIKVNIETPKKHGPIGLQPNESVLLSGLRFHVIDAKRRFETEHRTSNNSNTTITARNIKKAIFYAYLSSNIDQKNRLNTIKKMLSETPYQLGELDVALDPQNDEIDIGFVRSNGRIPLESLGSGIQQLLLVLGQIFLNDYPIIAVEEPEMNLSPQYQAEMMSTLETLMQDPAVKLEQLFISTHSPYFEFTQNFYDVTYDPVKGTQVQRATSADYNQHFAIIPTGSDTGARLNSMNQVVLYDGVIKDLGLQRGDLVIFARNDAGRWEIRTGRELANELQQVTNGSVH